MNSDSSPAMNPQRTWADLCGVPRDGRGWARPPACHLGVLAGTRQPTQRPPRAFLGSAALRAWATEPGGPARAALRMTRGGASCTPPTRTRTPCGGSPASPLARRTRDEQRPRHAGKAKVACAPRGSRKAAGGAGPAGGRTRRKRPRRRPAAPLTARPVGPFWAPSRGTDGLEFRLRGVRAFSQT